MLQLPALASWGADSQALLGLQACQVCTSPSPSLSQPELTISHRAPAPHHTRFCSTTCSKAAWPTHKLFCTTFATVRRRPHAFLPPLYDLTSAASIHDRRETQRAQWMLEDDLLDAGMGSKDSGSEGQLLWREPRCGVCWDREGDVERREGEDGVKADGWTEEVKAEGEVEETKTKGWRTCPDCSIVPWCGSVHEDMDRAKHSKVVGPYGFTEVCSAPIFAPRKASYTLSTTVPNLASLQRD